MVEAEQCIYTGDCHCGVASPEAGLNVIAIRDITSSLPQHCAKAGFQTVITLPVRLHERLMGEVDLFFYARINPSASERSLLEALSRHLASGMENLRLNALEMEAAVSQERHLLARELHDSIAQSLAFLKIQVRLMRDAIKSGDPVEIAKILEEIDIGVRESYGDVRELLLHFRTRTNAEDIEPALATTLRKFEHQSDIKATLAMQGQGLPLSPDLQIQVLHIFRRLCPMCASTLAPRKSGSTCNRVRSGALKCVTTGLALTLAAIRSTKRTSACASCQSGPSALVRCSMSSPPRRTAVPLF